MRALIVGGGIGGLSAAIGLRSAGIEVEVLEKIDDPAKAQVGGGFHVWANGFRALQELGLEDRAREIGAVLERTEFRSWRGSELAVWPLEEISREVGATDLGVSRSDLQRMLYDAADAGTIRSGAELTAFSDDGAGVTATLADGGEDRADFLVGADGLRSTVRARLLGKEEPDYAGYIQWQTATDEGADLLERGLERITFGPGLRTVVHHVGGGKLFWAGAIYGPESGAGAPPRRREMLLERFRGWPPPIEAAIESTPEEAIVGLPVYDRKPVKRWGTGRVTLLGDAAHPMTTNTGQGGNQAILDAVALARSLRSEPDVETALRRYEQRRIADTMPLVKRSRQAANWNAWSDPVRSRLRDFILGKALPGPGLRELREKAAVEL
jgi:2-polyprenyl-6-methoxyphenol hydroxylase-like FAD-dependent oxidoreductase